MASLKALLPNPVNVAEKLQSLCIHGGSGIRSTAATMASRGAVTPSAPISLLSPAIAMRRFGLEIESVVQRSTRHQNFSDILHSLNLSDSAWRIVDDKSVEAQPGRMVSHQNSSSSNWMCCELVSPVLDYTPSTLSEIESIWHSLSSDLCAQTNASCGLHIHLDADDLSLEDIVRVAANYAYFEPVIDLFMSMDRRGDRNPYIASVRRAVSRPSHWDLLRRVLDGEASHLPPRSLSVLDAINPKPRKKHKLNLTNSFYHGLHLHGMGGQGQKETAYINTIENRHHNATLRYDEVARWIRFNLCFVHIAKTKVFVEEELDIDGNEPAEIWRRFKVLADLMADDDMMGHYEQKIDEALRGQLKLN